MALQTSDILANLGYTPRVHGHYGTKTRKRTHKAGNRGAKYTRGERTATQKASLERESRHWRDLKAKWAKQLDDAYNEHDGFADWLDLLYDERNCHMPKPGIVDWDVRHEVRRLKLRELPAEVRMMALQQFKKHVRKAQKRHGWTANDDPFPKGMGPGKDCYTSDFERVKAELEIR